MVANTALAIKVFPEEDIDSWINEYDIYSISALQKHPNIAQYISSFPNFTQLWLITLYYEHGSLFEYLKTNFLDLKLAIKMAFSMLNGLAFLHEDIIQGQLIKPVIVHRYAHFCKKMSKKKCLKKIKIARLLALCLICA